jgi:acetoacetyl-CoA synthetase
VLFVQLAEGLGLDDPSAGPGTVRQEIATALRTKLSPRHVPDVVHQVSALPHTLSGKRIEVPVKKILQGVPTDQAVARGALTAPHALAEFEAFRSTLG